MSEPSAFKWMMVFQLIWKKTGWGTIIFLAALLSIDQSLYEAAAVDGANRWQRLWNVTLPGIVAVTILLLILRLGNILSVGFRADPAPAIVRRARGWRGAGHLRLLQRIIGGQWGMTAAAGLVKGSSGWCWC